MGTDTGTATEWCWLDGRCCLLGGGADARPGLEGCFAPGGRPAEHNAHSSVKCPLFHRAKSPKIRFSALNIKDALQIHNVIARRQYFPYQKITLKKINRKKKKKRYGFCEIG